MKRSPLKRGRKKAWTGHGAEERDRIYGTEERRAWVTTLPCIACGSTPSQNAHSVSGGMGRKADHRTIVPLCASCHHEVHSCGIKTFQREFNVDLPAAAVRVADAWDTLQTGA